jgi:glutamyl-tRNA synthetase
MHELMDVLRWLGIDWDEGPDAGGPHAPYRQSERFDLYRAAADRLYAARAVYRCYDTAEELEERRKQAMREGRPPGYDRRCRFLSDEQRAAFEAEGRAYALRFAVPLEGSTSFVDAVRGEITFENTDIADFIVLRSDGSPTYLLAAAVDDLAMKISHVIRGDDLISATPRQMMLYDALGPSERPSFAHLPLIVGADHKPLSKRHGHTSVEHYRTEGYLPEALSNYLSLLGWSYGDGTTERFTREQLVEHFALEGVSKNPAAFDTDKLRALDGEYIRGLPVAELAGRLRPFFDVDVDQGLLERVTPLVQTRMDTLMQGPPQLRFFFVEPTVSEEDAALYLTSHHLEALKRYASELDALPAWDRASIEGAMRGVQEELGLTSGKARKTAFHPVRLAVTGALVGPPLFESLEILGRETTLQRVRKVVVEWGG